MIFETLYESSERGELILVDGGYCRWHRRRDGVSVVYEIISQRLGAGQEMLSRIPTPIVAKCPADLVANSWYERRGFRVIGTEMTSSGRNMNIWRLDGNDTK